MDFIFDFILDLILDDGIKASKSKKISKPLRYIILSIVLLVYISIIGLITILGINTMKDNLLEGILILMFGIFILLVCILRFKAVYKNNIEVKKK